MVFNRDILFIHLGKTGGISVASYLCRVLKPPVVSVVRFDEFHKLKQVGHEIMISWKRHANLVAARAFLKSKNILIEDFKKMIIVIRDPVDLDFSYYRHLRTPRYIKKLSKHPVNKGRVEAAQKDYPFFAKQNFTHYQGNLKDFFELDGKIPENMEIIRFENLSEAIPETVKPFTVKEIGFPHINASPEQMERPALSADALRSIKEKYRWIYDKNFYRLPQK